MPYNRSNVPAGSSVTQQNATRDAISTKDSNNTTNSHNTTHDHSTNTHFHDSSKQNNFQGMTNSGSGTQTFG
ncbi:hypothetical protein K440DRAFT_611880 [Wilcoxina mikolae CBS 423.85]|nr:hypothetical protein K440DRAFT_611880 [Wilcoxina mikolae CBS 423.85]